MTIYFSQAAQIFDDNCMQIVAIQQKQISTKVLSKYTDYANVFLFNLAINLSENTGINKHVIKLEDSKQPSYRPIYSLRLVELKVLKTYIKTYFKTAFIQSSKSPAYAPILFDKKLDGSFWLCVYYWGLNNLTINN